MSYMERDGTGQKKKSGMLSMPFMYQALGWASTHAFAFGPHNAEISRITTVL